MPHTTAEPGRGQLIQVEPIDRPVVPGFWRRKFLELCGVTATLMGLESSWIPRIAAALEKAVTTRRPPVIWLNFASDTGCTEALLKAHYSDRCHGFRAGGHSARRVHDREAA